MNPYAIRSLGSVRNGDIIEINEMGMDKIKEIMIVGAGTSTSIPHVACLVGGGSKDCLVCLDAAGRLERSVEYQRENGGPPPGLSSRNGRSNPSALIRYGPLANDSSLKSILIDCGKSFYANHQRLLECGTRRLDAVLLTHGHADAILGLDDLRHWAGTRSHIQPYVDIYCDDDTMTIIRGVFPYLVDTTKATGGGEVSSLCFHTFVSGSIITIGELEIQSIKVQHGIYSDGRPYYANGFIIEGLAYLSDVSHIPKASADILGKLWHRPHLLVTDCLLPDRSYTSHYGWPQARELIKQLAPRMTILVGMSHHIDYYRFQRLLDLEDGVKPSEDGVIDQLRYRLGGVYVGFDGLLLKFNHD